MSEEKSFIPSLTLEPFEETAAAVAEAPAEETVPAAEEKAEEVVAEDAE